MAITPVGLNITQSKAKEPKDRINALSSLGAMQCEYKSNPVTSKQITKAFVRSLNDSCLSVRITALYELAMNSDGEKKTLGIIVTAIKKDGARISVDQLHEIIGHMCASECGIKAVGSILANRDFPMEARAIAATELGSADAEIASKYLEIGTQDPAESVKFISKLSLANINQPVAQE